MKKIVKYQLATSDIDADFNTFLEYVDQLIKEGFQPFGGICSSVVGENVYFAQAMVKYEN